MSSYQPVFDGRFIFCPCCGGSGRVLDAGDPTGTNTCGLCRKTGLVIPAVARRYLLDMSDYTGRDNVTAVVDAWYKARQVERDNDLV